MRDIQQKANNLKKKYGTACPFELCEKMGINIFYFDLPDCVNGLFFKYFKNYIIIVNSGLCYEDCRVTVAHELGHIILHNTTNSFQISVNTDIPIQRLEKEADYFASCLLIDENEIKSEYCGNSLTVRDIASISRLPESMVILYANTNGYLQE